jgi:hypothetical protein
MEEAELPMDSMDARADLTDLLVRPGRPGVHPVARRHDLLAVRGLAGDFLVPADGGALAARTLRAYNRLRPARVRAARGGLATAFTAGLGRFVTTPRPIEVPAGHESLLDHLATTLGVTELRFAGTARARAGFVTPVLQLFTPAGSCVGFAKIGWDDVTRAMVDTEADALRRAAAAATTHVEVPAVLAHGRWHDLSVLVTAPMPVGVTRLPVRERIPSSAITEIAAIDGFTRTARLRDSDYWQDAARTAGEALVAGRHDLADRFEALDRDHGDVTLPFGRWHGDLVPWNVARRGTELHVWDWAYSAPAVPLGFDALHFSYLPTVVLDGTTPDDASALAAVNVAPVLADLGLDAAQRATVVALHRLEQDLREERARLQRRAATPVGSGRP